MLTLLYADTFAEDASRFSASQATVVTVAQETASSGVQDVCSGSAGAHATCVIIEEYSLGVASSFTQTFSAVRTPAFTITSKSGSGRVAAPFALVAMALTIAGVLYTAVF